jgi:hypothetical protein
VRRPPLQRVRPRLAAGAMLAMIAMLAGTACAGRGAEVAPPDGTTSSEGSCDERARARALCLSAVQGRCGSMRADCEARCEPRLGPGNSEKEPALRSDIEAERCREGCRQDDRGCRHALIVRCPRPCQDDAGT